MTSEYERDYCESIRSGGEHGMHTRHEHPIIVDQHPKVASEQRSMLPAFLLAATLWVAAAATTNEANKLNPLEVAVEHTTRNF